MKSSRGSMPSLAYGTTRRYTPSTASSPSRRPRWRPELLRPLYAEFFRNVRNQPGAPVIGGVCSASTSTVRGAKGSSPQVVSRDRLSLSVVACVSDQAILEANLLASPGLTAPGSPHEVILIHDAPSTAAGLTMARCVPGTSGWRACIRMFIYRKVGIGG